MKLCSMNDLITDEYFIHNVSAIVQTPTYHSFATDSRICNGFLLIESGECTYFWNGEEMHLFPGMIIYLPLGSRHHMNITTSRVTWTRINFTVTSPEGEDVLFSTVPVLIDKLAGHNLIEIAHKIAHLYLVGNKNILISSLIYELFSQLCGEKTDKTISEQLQPIVDYIDCHYTQNIDCAALAKKNFLSQAQMYRLFKKETGETPIIYKNRRRIEQAKKMLINNVCSVGEIAELLGYESSYYFCRVFRKFTGTSPLVYKHTFDQNNENK